MPRRPAALLLPWIALLAPLPARVPQLPAAAAQPATEQEPFPLQARYRKSEHRIPMRDGTLLYTAVYAPRQPAGPRPVLLTRTPYGCQPYGPEAVLPPGEGLDLFLKDGYILVFQDVRGRFQSQGVFQHMRPMRSASGGPRDTDEGTDAYDTIDWLLRHVPDHNGRVGLFGLSYPGFYAAAGLVRAHPALKAVSPQAPIMDWFIGDDDHRNGALCLDMFEFYAGFFGPETNHPAEHDAEPYDFGTPDGYRFYLEVGAAQNLVARDVRRQSPFLREMLEHPNYDAFWQARNLRPHLQAVRPAVLTVGGWYDGENLFGALQCFKTLQRQSPGTDSRLVMGPWYHGQWRAEQGERLGQAEWGQATSVTFREQFEKPFFDHHLLGGPDPNLAKATLFEVGRNRWRRFDAWPPPQAKATSFYFQGDGRLAATRPAGTGAHSFVADPARPVPYRNDIGTYHSTSYLVDDQRFAATRPDVLVFESEPLAQDLTVAGPVQVDLQVSTTGTDADWVVKLIDVHSGSEPDPVPNPKGYRNGHWQELVRADVMRGRFRSSYEKPQPFVPGRPTPVAWSMNDVLHTFRKGHRIMVQVQCSWFPLVDRNPQTFVPNINKAAPKDYVKATQRVHLGGARPSRIVLPVLASAD